MLATQVVSAAQVVASGGEVMGRIRIGRLKRGGGEVL